MFYCNICEYKTKEIGLMHMHIITKHEDEIDLSKYYTNKREYPVCKW